MPIKQIYKKEKLFFEKYVALSKNKKMKLLYKKADTVLIKHLRRLDLASSNGIIEYPLVALKFLKSIAKKIDKFGGGLLILDYGYLVKKNRSTLKSVKNHKYVNLLSSPHSVDITSYLNFDLFNKILINNNLNVKKTITQGEFLRKVGIMERANILSKKMTFKEKANMYFRLKRLVDYNEMGNIFKVLFAQKKDNKFSLGF